MHACLYLSSITDSKTTEFTTSPKPSESDLQPATQQASECHSASQLRTRSAVPTPYATQPGFRDPGTQSTENAWKKVRVTGVRVTAAASIGLRSRQASEQGAMYAMR